MFVVNGSPQYVTCGVARSVTGSRCYGCPRPTGLVVLLVAVQVVVWCSGVAPPVNVTLPAYEKTNPPCLLECLCVGSGTGGSQNERRIWRQDLFFVFTTPRTLSVSSLCAVQREHG